MVPNLDGPITKFQELIYFKEKRDKNSPKIIGEGWIIIIPHNQAYKATSQSHPDEAQPMSSLSNSVSLSLDALSKGKDPFNFNFPLVSFYF